MASNIQYIQKGRRKSKSSPPQMSELRIILLGKDVVESSRVGNVILGRSAFETEAPPPSVEQQSERVRGQVEGRYITLINTPHLLHPQLSEEQLMEKVKDCMSLAAPGPHVILLVLQASDFTEDDRKRMGRVFNCVSEDFLKYTMVVTTPSQEQGTSVDAVEENILMKFITECNNRSLELKTFTPAAFMEMVEKVIKENKGNHLKYEEYEEAPLAPEHYCHETSVHKGSEQSPIASERLNLVLCGCDAAVKASISDLLVGQREQRAESSSVCVKREVEVSGHLLTLVEMPALYNTHSEQQVMQQTLHCVSLCPPGVHAFLFVVAEGRLTDEDKAEIETFQMIFSSRVHKHTIVLINQKSQKVPSDECLLKGFGGSYKFSGKINTPELIICVKKLLNDNKGNHYTMDMYHEVQIKIQLQYKREIKELQQTIIKLKEDSDQQGSSQQTDTLRIVLLGKTGVGKSATGNTILGKDVFHEDIGGSVTVMCQKESANVNSRQITVIDTPGLFDTNISNMTTTKEITKCISMAAPGPHVFLLVLSVGSRFTQEERDTVNLIKETFGEKSQIYTMVLFSKGDSLKGNSIEQYIEKCGADMKKLIYEFGNRYHVFNNNENKSNYAQVSALLDKINSMIKVNGGSCYTNEMFQQVETEIQKNQERILMEKHEEMEREKEELKAKYEAQMEDMKKEMENERERQKAEANRKEEEFKEKEQKMINEFREQEEKEREYYRKRREENELMFQQKMADINREKERNREQLEKKREEEQRQRDKEEEKMRTREEEWEKRQREEKEKFEQVKEVMKRNAEEEVRKLQQENEEKRAEEEKRRANLEEQIRHAEKSKKKQLQEQQLAQQRVWERRMKEEEKKKKERENEWKKKTAAMEDHWKLQQTTKQRQYKLEREKEKKKRDVEEKLRKEKEEQEKKRIEDEANEKIRLMKEQMEEQKGKEERERKEKDEQHKRDLEEKLEKQREDLRKEKENEERIRREDEERNIAFIKETHEKEKENLKKQTELQARQQAEQKYNDKLEEKVEEAKTEGIKEGCAKLDEKCREAKAEGIKEGCEKVESERTRPGRTVDSFINWVCSSNSPETVKKDS